MSKILNILKLVNWQMLFIHFILKCFCFIRYGIHDTIQKYIDDSYFYHVLNNNTDEDMIILNDDDSMILQVNTPSFYYYNHKTHTIQLHDGTFHISTNQIHDLIHSSNLRKRLLNDNNLSPVNNWFNNSFVDSCLVQENVLSMESIKLKCYGKEI